MTTQRVRAGYAYELRTRSMPQLHVIPGDKVALADRTSLSFLANESA